MDNNHSPLQIATALNEYWSPKIISEIDNHYVKVAKLKGTFVWHDHQDQDELFFILKGSLLMEYKDKKVLLQTGDLHVVPKGVMHNPIAEEECLVMLIEDKATAHTGDTQSASSRSREEQLGIVGTENS